MALVPVPVSAATLVFPLRICSLAALAAIPLFALTQAARGQAQAQNEPGSRATTATVPASNEAMLLFSRVEQAIQQADWRLALALRERLMGMGAELVIAPPGRTYYPIWRQAAKIFDRLPPEGRDLFRQLYDAEASARLREAAGSGDIAALRGLFRTYAGATAWPAIGGELVAQLLDQGQFGEAIETIQLLGAGESQLPPERRAELIVALGSMGQWQAAGEHLARLAADDTLRQRASWPQRLVSIRAWLEKQAGSAAALDPARFDPELSAGPLWRQPLTPAGPAGAYDDDLGIAEAITLVRRLPLQTVIVDDDTLLTRMRGTIWAYDALTLTPRWRVQDEARGERAGDQPGFSTPWFGLALGSPVGQEQLSTDANLLLSNALRHSLATGFGLVFTIESLGAAPGEMLEGGTERFGSVEFAAPANELVARELATGRLAWRRGHDPTDPLYSVAFQDVPVVVGDSLCVPFMRSGDLSLCLLDPATGDTQREVAVVGPPTFSTAAGGRCQLVSDESSIYVCTGNGVIAALNRGDLSWKWATTYPSTLAERRSSGWWPPREMLREYGVDRPVLAGDFLVVAPIDGAFIFALDRFTGRQRWRTERGAHGSLIGAVPAGVLLAGDCLTCLDITNGSTNCWRSVPLALTGRPAICGERIFVPTIDGVAVLEGRTGKILVEPAVATAVFTAANPDSRNALTQAAARLHMFARHLNTANLLVTPEAIFAVTPNFVVKFPDLGATRQACAALLSDNPGDERARLAEVWLDMLSGDYAAALARVEQLQPRDEAVAAACEALLTDIFIALSDNPPADTEQLGLLRRAAAFSKSEEVSARLAVLIGRALEEVGDWPEAARQYGQLLDLGRPAFVSEAGDPHYERDVWLQAISCLRAVTRHLAPESRDQLWEDWLSSGSPLLLERLRLATENRGWLNRIDRALMCSSLPAEIRARYIVPDDPNLPADVRRDLHLARWDIHVRLGLLSDAQADQRFWEDELTDLAAYADTPASNRSSSAPATQPKEQVEARVRRIENATSELYAAVAPFLEREPIGRYRWKIPDAELIAPEGVRQDTACILIRHLRDAVIGVHGVIQGRQYREVSDILEAGVAFDTAVSRAARAWWAGQDSPDDETAREVWPVATDGYLAAVSVQGGLLGVGLGCERTGGKLWEHAMPEWSGIPADSGATVAAAPDGVFVARRQDHVALLGWSDGATWWERSLPGVRIERVIPAGRRLVIFGQDGEVASVDALYGDQLRTLSPVGGTPRAVAVVAGLAVVFTEDKVGGFDPLDFACCWLRPVRGLEEWMQVAGSDWLAYRERGINDWRLIDARTGDAVFERGLGPLGLKLTAAAVDQQRLLTAAFERRTLGGDTSAFIRLAAFDRHSGQRLWERELQSLARINSTQLLAHPDLIPVLVARSEYEYTETHDYHTLALRLLDKRSGELTDPVSILDDFRGTRGKCGAYLLATPSRIVVQSNGTIAAYGPASGKR